MTDQPMQEPSWVMVALLGAVTVISLLLGSGLGRAGIPSIVGYLLLGFGLRLAEEAIGILPSYGSELLGFLGDLGVIALLFRVGIESDVRKLGRQIGTAGPLWVSSVLVSGAAGYAAARWALGLTLVPSLFIALALTATSVGVSLSVWREHGALDSETGALLVDTVELDDFSGVVLMALLFGLAPQLRDHTDGLEILGSLASTTAIVLAKATLLAACGFLFARHLEEPMSRRLSAMYDPPHRMLVVVGIGFMMAALAEWLGFSLAIGAFFAGLLFSQDPDSVRLDASFEDIYSLLVPFFFLSLGFQLSPGNLDAVMMPAIVLGVAAVVGKVIGTGAPALGSLGTLGALTLGLSMVPRAEIAMVIMERGMSLGDWAVTPRLFGAMVLVSLATTTVFPVVVQWLLVNRPGSYR